MTQARRAAAATFSALLIVYVATMAPGVTFWDAGEFIAAAHGLGIPHPPGTPLYVALGRAWIVLLGPMLDAARAMNALSALSTAAACAIGAWLLARPARGRREAQRDGVAWGATAGGLSAGLGASIWSNATETEVYAIALLHVAAMLLCAVRAGDSGARSDRWMLALAYLIALAPAVHLSALVGAPAAIVLASRDDDARWDARRLLVLSGVLLASAGIGTASFVLTVIGLAVVVVSAFVNRGGPHARDVPAPGTVIMLMTLASSALLIMLVRARHDPPINQGNPVTFGALADVVGRRQYDVAPLWPRQAPPWLQVANVLQYVDWQFALGLGRGVFTSLPRVTVTLLFLWLGTRGFLAMRKRNGRLSFALLVLLMSGTAGVCGYLNLKAGASLGWGLLATGTPHEARERDYFFTLGFWAWGLLAGAGAMSVVRTLRLPRASALAVAVVPLLLNWRVEDRQRAGDRDTAHVVARALLSSAPQHAVLFVAGDNDSYPLWYLQQVEGVRPDVALVTLSLLPAEWYGDEVARRTGLRWSRDEAVAGTQWRHQQLAVLIGAAARRAGRPVAVSPQVDAADRTLVGGEWRRRGFVYVSRGPRDGSLGVARGDSVEAARWLATVAAEPGDDGSVDGIAVSMRRLLECPRLDLALGAGQALTVARRMSLESTCNRR